MRKESWFRGALLSVLFFALLIGGAPTAAGAYTSGGSSEGNTGLLNIPCPPGGANPGAAVGNLLCESYNERSDMEQCMALSAAVVAAGFVLAGIEAHIASGGLSTAALALAILRHGRALANYVRALGVLMAAGCAWALD